MPAHSFMDSDLQQERRSSDANYIYVMGKLELQEKTVRAVEEQLKETRSDFKHAMKEHRESNDKVVEAIKGEIATLAQGFTDMTNNVKRIQYILLGGAMFYILDSIGLKAFLIKIMGV
jgi:ABC-type Zn uptake system ZnuABC Zn-binding protein ZnuA